MCRDARSALGVVRFAVVGSLAVVTLLATARVGVLSAQVAPGDRIRVRTVDEKRLVGRLAEYGEDTLVLIDASGAQRRVVRSRVTRLEVSRGQHRRLLAGAVVGTLAGALVGTAVGVALDSEADAAASSRCRSGNNLSCGSRWFDGIEVGIGAVLGSSTGLVAGLVAGSFRVEKWRAVPLTDHVAFVATPSRVGLSVSFP